MIDWVEILKDLYTVFGSFLLVTAFGCLGVFSGVKLKNKKGAGFIKTLPDQIGLICAILVIATSYWVIEYLSTLHGLIAGIIIFLIPFILGFNAGKS